MGKRDDNKSKDKAINLKRPLPDTEVYGMRFKLWRGHTGKAVTNAEQCYVPDRGPAPCFF